MGSMNETTTFNPDGLISGDYPLQHNIYTLATGQSLLRGALLGVISLGAAVVGGAGTGDGILTPAAEVKGPLTQVGVYSLLCITAAANGGVFAVFAPDGARLADATVGEAYESAHVNFTIADGAADFVVGDTRTITFAAGSGEVVQSLSAALDGSQHPEAILAETADATAAAIKVPGYVSGQFDPNYLIMAETGHTEASVRKAFADKPIFLRAAV
jgi:hypothetical protein